MSALGGFRLGLCGQRGASVTLAACEGRMEEQAGGGVTREAAMSMYGGSGHGMEQEGTVTRDRAPLLRHFHPTSP